MHLRKQYSNCLISLPVQHLEKHLQERCKDPRMNKTVLYPSLSGETFSLDKETIKKKMGDILKVNLCVTIMGRLNVTAQYFFCSLDFFLLLFKSDQDVKRISGTKHLISQLVCYYF